MAQIASPTLAPPATGDSYAAGAATRHRRATPLASRGEPIVWITGMAMSVCLLMIVSLLVLTVVQGSSTFWPRPIDTVRLRDGTVFMGVPVGDEPYQPGPAEAAKIEAARAGPGPLLPGAFDADGAPARRLYRIGNKELRAQPYQWVPLYQIASTSRDPDAAMVERREWGVWIGRPEAVVEQMPDGKRTVVAEGPRFADEFARSERLAAGRRAEAERLKRADIGEVNRRTEAARLALRQTELDARRSREQAGRGGALTVFGWLVLLVGTVGAAIAATIQTRRLAAPSRPPKRPSLGARLRGAAGWVVVAGMGLPLWLANPWSQRAIGPEELSAATEAYARTTAALEQDYRGILSRIEAIDAEDARQRVIFRDITTGKFAPTRQTEPDQPLRVSQVVRMVQPNALSLSGKFGVYLDRWREFLLDDPREANTEGGIFPVIFGTVLLTLLLSVAVVPLGVIAALYLREYARQGLVISMVRIAVNNLAGVPSIVYGVFGLGFFCYTVGAFVDAGPPSPLPPGAWWPGLVGLLLAVFLAAAAGLAGKPTHGAEATRRQRLLAILGVAAWLICAAGAVLLIYRAPYFHGLYEARLPSPTFGTRGLFWAALTLSLLTLPVVIVATEEAIAAVPRTMREGSYGCGASKWQTIRRIVLPRAMPGIMTGMILAMARGAGEVAPLMLVGAVKLAPQLPAGPHWPFLHLDRSFMHLGFHIYDLGFQSPDAEAARPLVWTTTLVLVAIVLLLNLGAIRLRARFRRRFVGGAF